MDLLTMNGIISETRHCDKHTPTLILSKSVTIGRNCQPCSDILASIPYNGNRIALMPGDVLKVTWPGGEVETFHAL